MRSAVQQTMAEASEQADSSSFAACGHLGSKVMDLFLEGNRHMAYGRHAEAIACYDEAIAHRPHVPEFHFNRANACAGQQKFRAAVESYDKALGLRPDYAPAHANRGRALYELGQFLPALQSFDLALLAEPALSPAHLNRGNALLRLRQYDNAIASYDRAKACDPHLIEAIFNKSIALQLLFIERNGVDPEHWLATASAAPMP